MGIVKTIGNALVPARSTGKTAQQWREEIAGLVQKRRAAQQRVENNGVERDRLALAAAQGDLDAQSALDVSSADEQGLKVAVDNLDRALALAHRHLADAEAAEVKAARDGLVNRHVKALRDRVEAARDLDIALGDVARQTQKLVEASRRADGTFAAALAAERDTTSIGRPLGIDMIGDAIVRRMHALGLSQILHLKISDVAPRVDDLADEIRRQNRRGELTAMARVRSLNPEPPEAA